MMKTKLFFVTLFYLLFVNLSFADQENTSVLTYTGNPLNSGFDATKHKISGYSKLNNLSSQTDSLAPDLGFNELFTVELAATSGVRLNPKAVSFVEDYMEKNTSNLMKLKEWGRPYFNMMDAILAQHNLPAELKYLAIIESRLKSSAVSWAGAVGPWQFMPATARGYGLVVNKSRDDRKDYRKSTHAAARYLKNLYNEFGDWLLVIAAYNGGPGVVYNAIKKSKSRNFWDLQYHLPAESRNHVKKFIGTHYIFEGQGGITTLTKAEAYQQIEASASHMLKRNLTEEELSNASTAHISGKYHSAIIAKNVLMEHKEFMRYNPEFDRLILGDDDYELKLPEDKMALFNANKYQILNESVNLLLNSSTAFKTSPAQSFATK